MRLKLQIENGSNKQGWQAQRFDIGTFLANPRERKKLGHLKIILDSVF